jgi:carboxyl-terminal processing protease
MYDDYETDDFFGKRSVRRRVMILTAWLLSLLIVASATFLLTRHFLRERYESDPEEGLLIRTVRDARNVIRDHYFYYTDDETALTEAALKGLAEATGDDYAEDFTAEEYENLQKQNQGSFVGIGILTQMNDEGSVEIIEVYENTPASEAGLQAGDILVEINGVDAEGKDLATFLSNLNAQDGVENTLLIRRGDELMTFTVIPREVRTPTVSYRMLTDTIGYIRVMKFHGECVEETKNAIEQLRNSGMKSLVFDLRDNLGGSLNDALDIADIFLPRDYVITSLRTRSGEETVYKTQTGGLDMRMVLLVNGMSASASELVAGAWKDHGAAYLIGTRTYGKGIVQSYFGISETGGMLKITTEAYYTPSGVCVHGEGIEPNQVVTLSEEGQRYSITTLPFELDTQLQAAIAYLED